MSSHLVLPALIIVVGVGMIVVAVSGFRGGSGGRLEIVMLIGGLVDIVAGVATIVMRRAETTREAGSKRGLPLPMASGSGATWNRTPASRRASSSTPTA